MFSYLVLPAAVCGAAKANTKVSGGLFDRLQKITKTQSTVSVAYNAYNVARIFSFRIVFELNFLLFSSSTVINVTNYFLCSAIAPTCVLHLHTRTMERFNGACTKLCRYVWSSCIRLYVCMYTYIINKMPAKHLVTTNV